MSRIKGQLPSDNGTARRAIYDGQIFKLPPTLSSLKLVQDVIDLMDIEFGSNVELRKAQFHFSDTVYFRKIGRLRKLLYTDVYYIEAVRKIMNETGFESDKHAFDPIRLRVLMHGGHENPKAAPVYFGHRDTWYSNPQSMVTWWIPLHDLEEHETFVFFPEYYRKPVKNGSAGFDYDEWTRKDWSRKIGWQDPDTGKKVFYPQLDQTLDVGIEKTGFSCVAGEILLFAGAHLHQTLQNSSGQTRFSMDFRAVHLDDHRNGNESPNVDNRSTGSGLRDYIQPVNTMDV